MLKKILITASVIVLLLIAVYFLFPGLVLDTAMYFERRAAGLELRTALVDDHTIMYLEGGEGENILLIHGYGQNKENWSRMAKFLTPSYHVICIDLLGAGKSSKVESFKYTINNQARFLDKFCEKIGLNTFHIVGNSMGGSVAACYALYAPQKIVSLALFDTAGVPKAEKSDFQKIMSSGGKNPFVIETSMDYDEFLKYVFVETPPIPGPVKNYFVEQAKENRIFNEKIGKDMEEEKYSIDTAGLNRSKIRTLILWGNNDRLCHVSGADILNKEIPGSILIIMDKCGHAPMIERPKETADHYIKFLSGTAI